MLHIHLAAGHDWSFSKELSNYSAITNYIITYFLTHFLFEGHWI